MDPGDFEMRPLGIDPIATPGRAFSTHFGVFSTHLGSFSAYFGVVYVENDTQKI